MSTATPLVFRPSLAQRSVTGLLFAGSWIVGIRLMVLLVQNLPRMHAALKLAQVSEEPTVLLWVSLIASLTACLLGGFLLVLSLTAMLLVEGTQVFVD
jgi:aryl carrier-like protein